MIAHQRRIRDEMMVAQPRESARTLQDYSVEMISRADAVPIILHYEWLRSIGRATMFVGLLSPTREIEGVACFGYGPAGYIRELIACPFGGGEGPLRPAICLERGACVHYTPPNAASFLINAACKLIYRITGTALFFAYADPKAGEYGAVYQAANWVYLGQGLDGGKGRRERYVALLPGADPNIETNWKSTRELRRKRYRFWDAEKNRERGLTFEEARAKGWRIGLRAGKHVYTMHFGHERDRRRWRKRMPMLPYPAPQPALKRKPRPSVVFTISSPEPPQPDLFRKDFFEGEPAET